MSTTEDDFMDEEEENEDDECCTGNHFFSFGSEDCEWCPNAELCRGLTLQHESFKKEARRL